MRAGRTVTARLIPTPLGELVAAVDDEGRVVWLGFADRGWPAAVVDLARAGFATEADDGACRDVEIQLAEYFGGQRRVFELPLAPRGSPFELAVWTASQAIPFGRTATYGELAIRLGRPGAARAVGAANGRNPIAIVIPCHRVIGADGSLTGYGGGLWRKRALLELEGVLGRGGEQLGLDLG